MMPSLVSKIRRRLDRRVSTLAGAAISHPSVHRLREKWYARALESHRSVLQPLSGVSGQIVADLKSGGISQLLLAGLGIPGSSQLITLGQELVAQELADFHSQADAGRTFLMMRPAPVIANPEVYLFGLNPVFLDIAEAYVGLPVAYDGVSIQYTLANGDEEATRMWHRDREDRKMLKIVLYLNDVQGDDGPFELLSKKFEPGTREPRYFLNAEERIALAAGKLGTPVSCEGPSGTAIFADTANYFHRGKPAIGRNRAAVFFSYFAQRPEYPFFCDRSGLPRSEIRRMVRGLTARQQRAALWREKLPLPLRLIPSYPVV